MNFEKVGNVFHFSDYKSFFRFINNHEGDLIVKRFEIYSGSELIAVFNHKER